MKGPTYSPIAAIALGGRPDKDRTRLSHTLQTTLRIGPISEKLVLTVALLRVRFDASMISKSSSRGGLAVVESG